MPRSASASITACRSAQATDFFYRDELNGLKDAKVLTGASSRIDIEVPGLDAVAVEDHEGEGRRP